MTQALPAQRSESVFADFKEPLNEAQAIAEANRCLYCSDAPCIKACPTAINIPEFIRKIGTGNVRGSARTIFDANILGTSCARVCPVEVLCVGSCVYNEMDAPPIQIGKLQRYSTDKALEAGWQFYTAGADTGKSVGLIGAGPASLAAAHELRKAGHAVTIYEKNALPGGLNTTGVAPYKMRADKSLQEAHWLLGIGGIEIRNGVVGKDFSWDELQAKHDALFLGFGLGADSMLGIAGEELDGVHGAVEFIERMKLGTVASSGVQRAAVIGGGNTAIDAVRELVGLGIPEVLMVYRGTTEGMSGYVHEWEAAKVDGVRALWQTLPDALLGSNGKVAAMRCARVDSSKNVIPGSAWEEKVDLVLFAVGQAKLGELAKTLPGVRVEKGRIITNDDGATGRAGVYAGGDCANGGKEVVNAAAEGKRAAQAIDVYLRGA